MMSNSGHRRPRVGWVVDVQRDFMEPDGRLYVHNLFDASDPGAQLARPTIVRTVAWMREHCDVVIFTGDWHAMGDREIDPVSPDATIGTYPPHCMGMSPDPQERQGAFLIDEINPGADALVLPRDATPDVATEIAQRAVRERRPVFIQKHEFSVFEGNAATETFLRALRDALGGDPEFIVAGVATDVCVRHAVEGFLDRQQPVRVVRDAMWGLGLLGEAETFGRWKERGAEIVRLDELNSAEVAGSGKREA